MSNQDLLGDELTGFASHKLVAARESLGITAGSLQRDLRLTPRVFEALESGELDKLGAPVFARGYIRAYCGRVGLEAESFVDAYNLAVGEASVKRKSVIKSAGDATRQTALKLNPGSASSILTLGVRLVIISALVATVAFAVSQINFSGLLGGSDSPEVESPVESQLPPMQGDSGSLIPIPVSNSPVEAEAPASSIEVKPTEAADTQVQVVAVKKESVKPAAGSKSVAGGAAGLVIGFSEVSWVNIKDGNGEAAFNGLAEKGKSIEINAKTPLEIVIGRADAVSSITFNGSTVDLEPHTRKNVARLTLSR